MADSTLASGTCSKPVKTLLVVCFLLSTLAGTNSIEARSAGIVTEGGCGCHGGMNSNTEITVDGLPDEYDLSEEYFFTLTISNENVPVQNPDQNGGFSIILTGGGILESVPDADGNVAQEMDGGLTHTMDINDRRTWEFKWTAPDNYSANVSFLIYGNAVNGNGAPSGNEWNGLEIQINPNKPEADGGNQVILTTVYISIGVLVLLLISVPIILTKRSINAVEESDFTKDYSDEIGWE
jgi:hypothetical protein